jgi:hypothetical protein
MRVVLSSDAAMAASAVIIKTIMSITAGGMMTLV